MRVCPTCAVQTDETGRFCPACGAALAAVAAEAPAGIGPSLVGARVDGQFEIEGVLANGAFAIVYRARQLGIDRPVALKVPTHEIAADPVMAKRFAREARAAARVRHPGVVTIYAVGELPDGRPYLAMELVEGVPLTELCADGVVPAPRVLAIGRQIASALAETHGAGVIHRDLKPSNIIWRRDRSGEDRVVIVDFGIAVSKPGNADATRLTTGGLIGTPHYMSPEQAHGEAVDGRADLYALGCILFELATGTTLFEGSGYEVLLAHLGRTAPRASERVAGIPRALDDLIADLVAKRPDDRPATAEAVVSRLAAALADPTPAPPRPAAARPRRPTAATRRELPDAAPRVIDWSGSTVQATAAAPSADMPERKARWIVGVALGALVLAGGGVVLAKVLAGGATTTTAAAPGRGEREYVRDDGDTTLHMSLPDSLRAGAAFTARLQLWNKLGQPLTEPPVLTLQDPSGAAKGFSARLVRDHFEFTRTLHVPGRYVLRVFPSATETELDVELEVGAGSAG